jgi:hypothetical protein
MPHQAPLQSGDPRRVGRYRLAGRITGIPADGAIYLGTGPDSTEVMISMLRSDWATDGAARDRFAAEAAVAKRVPPFCAARILDAGLDGTQAYLVSEYVPGLSLLEVISADGVLDEAGLDAAAIGMATGLASVHHAGLVHGSFGPEYVIMTGAGPRVVEFGITPPYGNATPAADMLAWAQTVVFAAAGKPAVRISDLEVLPARLRNLVADCLSPDPSQRPAARAAVQEMIGDAQPAAGVLAEGSRRAVPGAVPLPRGQQPYLPAPPTTRPAGTLPGTATPGWPGQAGAGTAPGPARAGSADLSPPPGTRPGSATRPGSRPDSGPRPGSGPRPESGYRPDSGAQPGPGSGADPGSRPGSGHRADSGPRSGPPPTARQNGGPGPRTASRHGRATDERADRPGRAAGPTPERFSGHHEQHGHGRRTALLAAAAVVACVVIVLVIVRLAAGHGHAPVAGPGGKSTSPVSDRSRLPTASSTPNLSPTTPASFDGEWSGPVRQPPQDTLHVTLTLAGGKTTGTVRYTATGVAACSPTLSLIRTTARRLTFSQTTVPAQSCSAGTVTITRTGPGSVFYSFHGGGLYATGTLTRS